MTIPASTYRPRHDWGAVRLSTTAAQLLARFTVVDAVGEPNPEHVGRHRSDQCTCQATGFVHEPNCRQLGYILQLLGASTSAT